jgi:hypothetical protein
MEESEHRLEFWMLEMADIVNYYNPRHKIIRVLYNNNYYDLKCDPGFTVPSQTDHLVLAMLPEGFFTNYTPISDFQLNLAPGLISKDGIVGDIPKAIAFLVPKKQTICTANPQSIGAAFNVENSNVHDMKNVAVAVTSPIQDKDYTTLDTANMGDINNLGAGLFINKQGTVLLRSSGGSITLGKEGVHIGGKLACESSVVDTGMMADNPFADLIPSTIVSIPASYPKIPNFVQITSLANASLKLAEMLNKFNTVREMVT